MADSAGEGDFTVELFQFMGDVCRIEAHVWAAEQALSEARVRGGGYRQDAVAAQLGYEFLLTISLPKKQRTRVKEPGPCPHPSP